MVSDPKSPQVLVSVADDIKAATIVGALADCGIQATASGGYTSGFQAAAPGDVKVLVALADLDRARAALEEIQQEDSEIDWPDVDVGSP